MKCPTCTSVDLLMTERQGIEIDYCPKCRGVWLDRGELDKFIQKAEEQKIVPPPVVAAPEFRRETRSDDFSAEDEKRQRREQERQRYERERYERERYERERHEQERRYKDDDRDDRYYRGKKRESFWGDLFDFD
jgi:uncharacterized protein